MTQDRDGDSSSRTLANRIRITRLNFTGIRVWGLNFTGFVNHWATVLESKWDLDYILKEPWSLNI